MCRVYELVSLGQGQDHTMGLKGHMSHFTLGTIYVGVGANRIYSGNQKKKKME